MKKIILTVAAVFALTFANAQDKKESSEGFAQGDLFLTGTASYNSVTRGDLKANDLTLSPGVGYFLTENLALVGQLSISSGKDFVDDGTGGLIETKTSGFGIAAGVNYYWTPASKFSLSLGGNISYSSNKQDFGGGDVTSKVIGVNVPLGLHYFVSDAFALTTTWGGLGYSTDDNGGNGADKTDSLSLGLDLSSVSFGLIYKL